MQVSINFSTHEMRVDSRALAAKLDHRHRNIIENIDKYRAELEELDLLPFGSEARIQGQHGGGDVRFALLSEDQCYFVLTLMRNNPHVVKAKLSLVKAFRDARAALASRDIARLEGKEIRKEETKAIEALVEYATQQGSKNAERYYMAVTKMTNNILGLQSSMRDSVDARMLQSIAMAEKTVDIAIRDGIKAAMPYKEIFQMAKARVNSLLPALGLKP